MRVLIACEKSGIVREAFNAFAGVSAFSCDLEPAEDHRTDNHYLCDVRTLLLPNTWDLLIAHPPCTYLASSGLHWTARGLRDPRLTEEALDFVRLLMAAPIPRICIENPQGRIGTAIRPADQYVQPYQFGDDASKKTGLWLKNLPPLVAHSFSVPPRIVNGKRRWSNQTDSGQNRLGPSSTRAAERARTYPGIARAMAEQWTAAHFANF